MSHHRPPRAALLGCIVVITILFSFGAGIAGGMIGSYIQTQSGNQSFAPVASGNVSLQYSSAVIDVVDKSIDSVVSIVVRQDVPNRRQSGSAQQRTVGAGSGFIITKEGLVLTNRHVVDEEDADYTVVLNDGTEIAATVIGRDPIMDIAVLKIDPGTKELKPLPLGNSAQLKTGQQVIVIGNSLGEFANTVSSGIISALERSIRASNSAGTSAELLDGVFQTDASINPGNSGGPVLDLAGNVVGVSVAIAQEAENIGFAIPIDSVKKVIDSAIQFGEIRRPYLGVRYTTVTPQIKEDNNLKVDYGALVIAGDAGQPGVIAGSPAADAGIQVGDVILEVNGVRLDQEGTSLQKEIQKYNVGDKVELKYQRGDEIKTINVTLEQAEL